MIIIGNGKSLEGFDFKKIKEETIGLCCAYRYWEKINWFPTYYCCVDHVVIKSHIKAIKNLIINKKCKAFLLSASIIQLWPNIQDYKNVFF